MASRPSLHRTIALPGSGISALANAGMFWKGTRAWFGLYLPRWMVRCWSRHPATVQLGFGMWQQALASTSLLVIGASCGRLCAMALRSSAQRTTERPRSGAPRAASACTPLPATPVSSPVRRSADCPQSPEFTGMSKIPCGEVCGAIFCCVTSSAAVSALVNCLLMHEMFAKCPLGLVMAVFIQALSICWRMWHAVAGRLPPTSQTCSASSDGLGIKCYQN